MIQGLAIREFVSERQEVDFTYHLQQKASRTDGGGIDE